jgi:HEAT repeat protein/outer membrane protein assembly factor BamB
MFPARLTLAVVLALAAFTWGAPTPAPKSAPVEETDNSAAHEALLKEAGVGADAAGLLAFFRARTLTTEDRRHVETWVRQLGSDNFHEREKASAELTRRGPAVRPYLKKALADPDAEVSRRAAGCLEEIDSGPGGTLPAAAARLLVRRAPAVAARVLLDYLSFADDEFVVSEVREALAALVRRPGPVDPTLLAALKDSLPVRRGAAAYALGHSRERRQREVVAALLQDREVSVRLLAARGLVAGRDKSAVAPLIALLTQVPADDVWQVEDLLLRIAGDRAPKLPENSGDEAKQRRQRQAAWESWWRDNANHIDLARLDETPAVLGLTLIPEMHANKVWECGRDGKPLWEVAVPGCPIDAQVLPGNRFLVAELNGNRVTERDRTGKVLWEYKVNTPIACERLPNGQTFISTNHRFCIVTSSGKEVSAYAPENGFFIHSIQRLRNGHVVCVSMEGTIREVDAAGRVVRDVPLSIKGGWSGIEGTPNGRYLVSNVQAGKVLEVDTAGKTVWEFTAAGICYAARLRNGHTLIVNNHSGLVEVDAAGKTVWSRPISTSLWRAHRR